MSSELMALVKRTQPSEPRFKEASPEPSSELLMLLERMEARKWKEEMLQETMERLCSLQEEIDQIGHIQTCTQCQFELAIDVERYGGNHSGLWFINLQNDDFLPEYYNDCPPASDYNFGSYWRGTTNHAEVIRFIIDRAKWAKSKVEEELFTVIDFYLALENWDLHSPLPPFTSDDLLFG